MKRREFLISTLWSFLFLLAALAVNFYATLYAKEEASNPVTDIILSNTQVYNFDFIFIWGAVALWAFVVALCCFTPRRIPFVTKSVALFILIRSLFISLTHIGPFPDQIFVDYTSFVGNFTAGSDLFFSGHTGLPFLLALIFWKEVALRYCFLISSILFGIIVLLSHVHYSIDVASAFFITYSIFHLAEYFFPKDRWFFENGFTQ